MFANDPSLTYQEAMDYIIGDVKGDTDTNASIVGAYIGARDGFKALMTCKRTRRNYRVLMKCKSDRPYKYTPQVLEDLLDSAYEILVENM